MRYKEFILFACSLLFVIQANATENKLLILGDSLSAAYRLKQEEGWVSLLQNAWKDHNIEVINAAISGDTTSGGLARLPRLLEQYQPTVLLIELGGNDGLQGYPVENIKQNLVSMIALAKNQNVMVLLLQMRIPTNYGKRYSTLFIDAYSELAEQYDVGLIPFMLDDIALNPDLMQADGIHPKAEAQAQISEFMQQQIGRYFDISDSQNSKVKSSADPANREKILSPVFD